MPAPTQIMHVASATAVGLGAVGALLPRQFAALYGYRADDDVTSHLTRLLSTRNASLGALGLMAPTGRAARQVLGVFAALDLVDVLLGLRAGSGLPRRARVLQVATSTAFLAASAAVLAAEET
jgi:hypothetical protein